MASALPTVEAALKGPIADEIIGVWTALASASSATGGYVRGLHAAESILRDFEGDPLALVIQNVAPHAAFVDMGHVGFHLPSHIKSWRISKNGKRFIIVRFRHFTEHAAPSGRAARSTMPETVQQLAKALQGRPLTGLGDLYKQSKSYNYYRGAGFTGVPEGAGYEWKKSKFEGLRHVGGKTPGGGSHGGYDTFRIITPFSSGFYIPPVEGQHFPQRVVADVGPRIAQIAADAAGVDLQATFVAQMNAVGAFSVIQGELMETNLKYDGLIFPELVLAELIRARLLELQVDESKLALFFQGLATHEKDSFINYLSQREIGVHLGWSALHTYEQPQIVISAASGDEDHSIGDALEERTVPVETLVAKVSATFTPTVQVYDATLSPQALAVNGVTGTWPTTGIISVGDEYMSYEGNFASGSISIIRRGLRSSRITTHAVDEPIVRYEVLRLIGIDQLGSYWLDVCHQNSTFVLVLAQIVQLALLRATRADPAHPQRQPFFTVRGILRPTLRVSDLAPHRMLYPTTAMVRSLHFTCRYQLAVDEHFELVHRPDAVGTIVIPTYVEGA